MRKSLPILLLLLLLAAAPAQANSFEHEEFVVDGVTRSYELFVPRSAGEVVPLLIVLHGRGGSGAGMASRTDFNELANAIVVYPDGLDTQWNYLTGLGGNEGVDDVGFLHELVTRISADHGIDTSRVYVTGYSNGGFMVQRLACEADSPFDSFASVAGAGFAGMPELCVEPRPVSMMLVHGTFDQVVPWGGQVGNFGGREILLSASVAQTFAFWASFAGCGGTTDRRNIMLPGPRPTNVALLRVTDCPAGTEVVLYAVVGGDHDWPRLPGPAGDEMAFDASREIVEFFDIGGE